MQMYALESTVAASPNRTHVLGSMGRSNALCELQLHLLEEIGIVGGVESGVDRHYR